MTNPMACIIAKAGSGRVNQKLVKELEEIIDEMSDPDLVARAARARDVVEFRVNKMKQQTALQIRTIQSLEETVAQAQAASNKHVTVIPKLMRASQMTLGMLSRLTYDPLGNFRGPNVEISWKIIRAQAESLFSEGLERFHRTHLGFGQDKAGLRNLVREIFGETSGDVSASTIAQAWKRVDDMLVRRMQRAGGTIFKRQDWGLPHMHDAKRIGAVSFDEWFEFIVQRLDRANMLDDLTGQPFTDAHLREVLEDVYETLRTNGLSKLSPGGTRGGRKLANRHQDARFLTFKNADSWFEYNEKFGTGGDIFELLTGHMDQMAREIAILENLGPNPDATIRWMSDNIRKFDAEAGADRKRSSVRDTAGARAVEKLYDILNGRTNAPATAWWAEANQFTRNILTSAQLGGAFLSATTDVNFARLTTGFNGLNAVRQQQTLLKQFFSGVTGKEAQRLAARLQLGAEQWSGTAIGQQRFLGEVTGPRTSRLIADTVMRGSLLTPWTYAGRHSFKQEVLMSVADNIGKSFNDLEETFRRGLERYGVDSTAWNNIRREGNFLTESGQTYFDPQAAARNGFSEDANKILQFAFTEAEYAVPSASSLTQLALTGGTQSGTFWGEMIRNVGLYKSFPLTVLMTHMARGTVYAGVQPASKSRYMIDLIISTTIFGGLVVQMKQIAGGKDPIEVLNWDHGPEFLAAAMLQGGGLGIFGDFLFADQNRFGHGPLQTLAGPVLGSLVPDITKLTIGNLQELAYGEDTQIGRDLTQFANRYTPASSLWYGKLGIERLLFDRLQDIVDPNADQSFRRKMQRANQDYGNDWWWAPGQQAPDRRPDLGAILQ